MRNVLNFIFGLPLSSKTDKLLKTVNGLSCQDKQSVIIVPEQASFGTEKRVLQTFGDGFSKTVTVLSFSRLYNEICRICGGSSAKVLSNTEKIIFMSRALKQVAPELLIWGKYAHSLTFSKTMLDTIGEFKINGITSKEIKSASDFADSQSLRNKLHDLSAIYDAYDLLIAERYLDPADTLTKLYYLLDNCKYFEDKTVFFDGFKGFTGQQYKIIDRIITQADDLYFAFTNDVESNNEYDLFTNIRSCVLKLENIAASHSIKTQKPIVTTQNNYKSKSLQSLERLLSNNEVPQNENDAITVCAAKTLFDEAEFAARTIRKLVRTQNYRYKDFVIIARDSEKYSQAIEYACKKNNIDCFFDKKIPLTSFPLSTAALAAIKALDFSTENILRFHKSGIEVLTDDEISTLENYTYLWNINGEIWLKEWDMDVRGFVTDEPTEFDAQKLSNINRLRQKAIEPLIRFKEEFKFNAKNMARAIINLFDNCDAKKALNRLCQSFDNDVFTVDFLKGGYDEFMQILDSLVICYNEQNLNKTEFYEALNLALSQTEIGLIPQTVDQVIFGQADRIRPSAPKIAFILGANQGVFPKTTTNNGVFAIKERKKLINLGLEIADNEIYSSIDENYLVYCNLCSGTDKIFVSYAAQSLKGEALSPASFVTSICDKLNPVLMVEPADNIDETNLPETLNSAYSEFCRRFNSPYDNNLLKCNLGEKAANLTTALTKNKPSISKENANRLYGKDIYMSATKFDTLKRCKFSFFCKYGLRLKRLQPADFDVLQRGTIVHYVLEKIISTYKDGIKDFSREKCDELCDFYIQEYLNSVIGYNTVKNARHDFLISKISRSLKEVVFHLSNEFAQSDFKPTHCELKIGGEDGIPLNFDYDDGSIIFNGSIDRVDEYNGYIRIVDYKTGTKSFKLPDILFGLNLQMLIYLYAVIRGQNLDDEKAAGIFYMPSKRDLNNEGMAMNGLIQGDKELVKAMEKENRGEFVPQLPINKDGSISKTATSFITTNEFSLIFEHIEKLMKQAGNSIANGEIEINPTDGRESSACTYCDFKSVCKIENQLPNIVPNYKNSEVFEKIVKGDNNGI